MVLALSITANLLFGILSFTLLKKSAENLQGTNDCADQLARLSLHSHHTNSYGLSTNIGLHVGLGRDPAVLSHSQQVTGRR